MEANRVSVSQWTRTDGSDVCEAQWQYSSHHRRQTYQRTRMAWHASDWWLSSADTSSLVTVARRLIHSCTRCANISCHTHIYWCSVTSVLSVDLTAASNVPWFPFISVIIQQLTSYIALHPLSAITVAEWTETLGFDRFFQDIQTTSAFMPRRSGHK